MVSKDEFSVVALKLSGIQHSGFTGIFEKVVFTHDILPVTLSHTVCVKGAKLFLCICCA